MRIKLNDINLNNKFEFIIGPKQEWINEDFSGRDYDLIKSLWLSGYWNGYLDGKKDHIDWNHKFYTSMFYIFAFLSIIINLYLFLNFLIK